MAIDYDRAAGDYVYAASTPMSPRSSTMECWFQLDPWGGIGVTYGHLMGMYAMGGLCHMVALILEEDATGIPTVYSLLYEVVNVDGTFSAKAPLTYVPGKWYHALGVWQGAGVGNIYCMLDGVLGATASASTGLCSGTTFYGFGADFRPWPVTNHFNGRIAEAASWYVGPPGTTPYLQSACKGWNPIDRDPFTMYSPTVLRAWTQMHNTTVHDIMQPSVGYIVSGAVTYADHPPVFEAARNEHFPRPPLAAEVAAATVHIKGGAIRGGSFASLTA